MGGAPYKSVKEGDGCSFECLTMKEHNVMFTATRSKQ